MNANGSPAGPATTMPGSQVMQGGGTVSKTPIVARAKSGGFYVGYALGYPTANRVRVWRVGASAATLLARTDANSQVTLAADAKRPRLGRLERRDVRRDARARGPLEPRGDRIRRAR